MRGQNGEGRGWDVKMQEKGNEDPSGDCAIPQQNNIKVRR
jgi:hypothetical protein